MPVDGAIVPLFGTGTKGFAATISAQRRTNLFVNMARSDQEKGILSLCPRPGMDYSFAAPVPSIVGVGGNRVCRGFSRGEFILPAAAGSEAGRRAGFFAMGNELFYLTPGSATPANSLSSTFRLRSDAGPVRFSRDSSYVVLVDGVTGYVFDPATPAGYVLADVGGAAGFPAGATTICNLAARFLVNKPGTGRCYYSAQNNPLSWGSLDYFTAEVNPDNLLAVAVDHGEALLFGQYTTEFWAPSGGSAPFARVGGAALEYGIVAIDSIATLSDGTLFLARNVAGDTRVMVVAGSSANPISTPNIETEIERLSNIEGGVGLPIIANGRTFYVLSFQEKTFAYNMTDGEWGYWQTGVSEGPWCGKYGALIAGNFIIADSTRNRFYVLNPQSATDGEDMVVREVVTKHINNDYDRFGIDKLGLDFETGVGLVSGQGSDPEVMLQVSRDNGHTYGNETWAALGALGNYITRVWFRHLGRARDWVFKIRWTDPILTSLTGGSIKVRR